MIKKNGREAEGLLIRRMNDKIIHRGPDDSGIFVEGIVGLGHRRLSILDLSKAGKQPMHSIDGRFVIVFNGEIYNYVELKKELQQEGAKFQNETDTEVIMEAYRYWGTDCTKRFNGMWAFALLDKQENNVLFSRDRFGVKPLYLYENKEDLVFASEIKCILEIYPQERIPNITELRRYMVCVQEDADENTFYKNIKSFPKSYNMVYDLHSGEKKWEEYWKIDVSAFQEKWKTNNPYRLCRTLLEDAVRLRLRADVEVGASLSGGLDSSTLVSIVNKKFGTRMHTFSSIYEEKDCDEKEFIDCMNDHTDSHRHYIYPDKEEDLIQDLKDMTYYHDGPCHAASPYSGFCVYRGVGDTVTVMLDGQGADEIFGGYMYYYMSKLRDLLEEEGWAARRKTIRLLAQIQAVWPQFFTKISSGMLVQALGAEGYRYLKKKSGFPNQRGNQGIRPFFSDKFWEIDMKDESRPDDTVHGYLNGIMNMSLRHTMLPRILHDVDRNSMARSLEVRLPFLDYRLVEFSYTLSNEQKIHNTWTKYVLRKSCRKYLPRKIWSRRNKMGFPAPFAKWIQDERYKDIIKNYLDSFKKRGIVKPEGIEQSYEAQLEGREDYAEFLFRCTMLELWLQEEIDTDTCKWDLK